MSFADKGGKMFNIKTNKHLTLSYKNYLSKTDIHPLKRFGRQQMRDKLT